SPIERSMVAIAILPATAWAEGAQLNGRLFPATASAERAQFNAPPFPATASAERAQLNAPSSLVALLLTDSATPPYIGIPIAGLPEPSLYDIGTAYYRRCMGVNSRAGWGRNCGGRRPRRRASTSAHGERGQTAPDAVGYGSQNVL